MDYLKFELVNVRSLEASCFSKEAILCLVDDWLDRGKSPPNLRSGPKIRVMMANGWSAGLRASSLYRS